MDNIEIRLQHRAVSCIAELLHEDAPETVRAVSERLPLLGQAVHARYANHEIYTLLEAFGGDIGLENPTITPAAGDVCFWHFSSKAMVPRKTAVIAGVVGQPYVVDLAVFYRGSNLLLSPSVGFSPGNVFARVIDGLSSFADACEELWMHGWIDERLEFRVVA